MKPNNYILLPSLLLCLGGYIFLKLCPTSYSDPRVPDNFDLIEVGMSTEDVVKLMGRPFWTDILNDSTRQYERRFGLAIEAQRRASLTFSKERFQWRDWTLYEVTVSNGVVESKSGGPMSDW